MSSILIIKYLTITKQRGKDMNIEELQDILKSKKIDITAREISSIWNMNEQSFSKKKKAKTSYGKICQRNGVSNLRFEKRGLTSLSKSKMTT